MASSNASIDASSRNPSHEHIAPLESVITGGYSGPYDGAAGVPTNRQYSEHNDAWKKILDSQAAWNAARKMLDSQRVVLKRLKAWHQWDTDRYESLSKFIMSKAGLPKRPNCPDSGQLFSLATYFFTPRWSLRVIVCDFGEGRFERFEVDLQNITQCK